MPEPVQSTSNVIYVELKSDWYRLGSKFLMDWTQVKRVAPDASTVASNSKNHLYYMISDIIL